MKKRFYFISVALILMLLVGCAMPALTPESSADHNLPNGSDKAADATIPSVEETDPPVVTANDTETYEVVYSKCDVYKDSIGSVWVQALIQIENTGTVPLYLDSSSADLETPDGKLVKTLSYVSPYPELLNPGETGLFVENTMLDADPGVNELTVIPHLDIEKAKVDCIRYATSEEELQTDSLFDSLKMIGRVENTGSDAENMIYVVANLYDANHHGIGQLFTIISDELKPGEKIGFSLNCLSAPDTLTEESVASYEVFAFPLQFQF